MESGPSPGTRAIRSGTSGLSLRARTDPSGGAVPFSQGRGSAPPSLRLAPAPTPWPVSGNSDAGIVCLAQHAPHTVGRWPLEQPQAFHNQRPQAIPASSKAIEKHPEAKKGGARAASCGGPCQNCHGGKVLDPKEEESLKLAWEDYPLRLWSWVTHLGSTLFMEHGTRHWSEIEKKLWSSQGRFLVWGSQKPNQRMFVCKCTECGAIVTAQYAVGDGEVDAQDARDTLAMFVIGKKAEDSKRS